MGEISNKNIERIENHRYHDLNPCLGVILHADSNSGLQTIPNLCKTQFFENSVNLAHLSARPNADNVLLWLCVAIHQVGIKFQYGDEPSGRAGSIRFGLAWVDWLGPGTLG